MLACTLAATFAWRCVCLNQGCPAMWTPPFGRQLGHCMERPKVWCICSLDVIMDVQHVLIDVCLDIHENVWGLSPDVVVNVVWDIRTNNWIFFSMNLGCRSGRHSGHLDVSVDIRRDVYWNMQTTLWLCLSECCLRRRPWRSMTCQLVLRGISHAT